MSIPLVLAYCANTDCGSAGVYSRDMFETRFGVDPMDELEGRRYRELVLARGGSLPEKELLKGFLGGRMPNGAAFSRPLDC